MSALSIRYESYFMDMVFSGAPLQRVIDEAASILALPVRFSPENRIEYAICSPDYPQEDIAYITRLLSQEERKFDTFLHATRQEEAMKPFLMRNASGKNERIFCNIMVGSRYFGNLSIPEGRGALQHADLDFVALIARTIALICSVTGLWGYDIIKSSLLQRVLSGTIRSREELIEHFGQWRADEAKPWRLMLSTIPAKNEPAVIQNAMQMIFPNATSLIIENRLFTIIEKAQAHLGKGQWAQLTQMAQMYGATMIVGLPFDDFLQARDQMLCLLQHPAVRKKSVGCFDYAEHIEYALFHSTRMDKAQAMKLFCAKLQTVLQYDQQHETQYFPTLQSYLANAMNIQRTASALYTHKNTILYRISRLQELFDMDLHNSQEVFLLSLGMSALQYWGE